MGVAQSPEGRKLFPRMSVLENLEMGTFQMKDRSTFEDLERLLALPATRGAEDAEGRHPLRRRAADGRHGPSAHGPPEAAHARRALHGPRPIFVERIFEIVVEINAGHADPPSSRTRLMASTWRAAAT